MLRLIYNWRNSAQYPVDGSDFGAKIKTKITWSGKCL